MNKLTFFEDAEMDTSIFQMESVASDLVLLLKHKGLSRTDLAKKLGWNKSRVTRVLSGDENLTIKTICAVSEALEYDFDVIFFNKDYPQPKQPWQIDRIKKKLHVEVSIIKEEPKKFIKFSANLPYKESERERFKFPIHSLEEVANV